MAQFQLTEKNKDRLLNLVLVGSLVWLCSGALRPSFQKTDQPVRSQYHVVQIKSFIEHPHKTYSERSIVADTSTSQMSSNKASTTSIGVAGSTSNTKNTVAAVSSKQQLDSGTLTDQIATKQTRDSVTKTLSGIIKALSPP